MSDQFGAFDPGAAPAVPGAAQAVPGAEPVEQAEPGWTTVNAQPGVLGAFGALASAQSILMNNLPPIDIEFLNALADKFPTDLEALHKEFDKSDLVEGKNIPKHRAYVCRINEACKWHSWHVVGYAVVNMPNDVWLVCLGRLIIPGVGVMDSIGSASYMDTCVLPGKRGNIADVNYRGYSPASRGNNANQSDMTAVAFEWVKMAETNAYVRAAFRLGVGAKTLMNFGDDPGGVDYSNVGGPVTPGAAYVPPGAAAPAPAAPGAPFAPPAEAPPVAAAPVAAPMPAQTGLIEGTYMPAPAVAPPAVAPAPAAGEAYAPPAAPVMAPPPLAPPPIPGAMPAGTMPPIAGAETYAPAAGMVTSDPVRSLHDAATPEERANLVNIAQGRGVDQAALEAMAQQKFQTPFEQLNRAQLVGLSNSIEHS